MAWIESHQGVERNPKTIKLSLLMGWDIDQTIGKLHRFWWWCLEFSADGNVSRHSADMVAISVGLSADQGEKFISAMYESEFLDKTSNNQFLIHDWLEYAGRYLKDTKFRRNPEKIKEIIALYLTIVGRQNADKTPTKRRKSAVPDLPDLTLPDLPDLTLPKPVSGKPDFESIIAHLNLKTGKDFKPTTTATRRNIQARWNEGFRIEHFKIVHENMTAKWLTDPKMAQYLRPETLYSPKFEGYLNTVVTQSDMGLISQKTEKNIAVGQAWLEKKKQEQQGGTENA